jgi:transcriptional regulator with XRE-family HTH domain
MVAQQLPFGALLRRWRERRRMTQIDLALAADSSTRHLCTPIRIATRFGTVSFLNTLTVFGTPSDVTLAELALEMLFPADEETIEIVAEMERERSLVGSPVPRNVQERSRA